MPKPTLSVYQGETLAFELEYLGLDGNPVPNLTDATVQLRLGQGRPSVAGTVDAASGVFAFEVTPAETAQWPGGMKFQVWLTYTSGKIEMVAEGQIEVAPALDAGA